MACQSSTRNCVMQPGLRTTVLRRPSKGWPAMTPLSIAVRPPSQPSSGALAFLLSCLVFSHLSALLSQSLSSFWVSVCVVPPPSPTPQHIALTLHCSFFGRSYCSVAGLSSCLGAQERPGSLSPKGPLLGLSAPSVAITRQR